MKNLVIFKVFIIAYISFAMATNLDQNVTVNFKNQSLEEVLNYFQRKHDVNFTYSNSALPLSQKLSFEARNVPLRDVLNKIFSGFGIEYKLINDQIALRLSTESNFITLSGQVIDSKTGEGIPYANIQLQNTSIGNVTNLEGKFAFHFNKKYADKSINISSMGYQNYSANIEDLKNENIIIKLQPATIDLKEVAVAPKDAREIVQQALLKKSENYPTEPFYLHAYYKEIVKQHGKYVKYADAACIFLLNSYAEKDQDFTPMNWTYRSDGSFEDGLTLEIPMMMSLRHGDDQIKLLAVRSSNDYQAERHNTRIEGGPLRIVMGDFVKATTAKSITSRYNYKNEIYNIDDITTYNNQSVYIISCENKKPLSNNRTYKKTYFINTETLVIIKIKIEQLDPTYNADTWGGVTEFVGNPKKRNPNKLKKVVSEEKAGFESVEIDYQQINDKWYISHIKIKTDTRFTDGLTNKIIPYETEMDLVVHKVETENIEKFSSDSLFYDKNSHYPQGVFLFDFPFEYNEDFWENYNQLVPTQLEEEITKDLEKQASLKHQFKNKYVKNDSLLAPIAKKIEYTHTSFGEKREDPYYWLQNRTDTLVWQHLYAENDYTKNYMIPLRFKKRQLYDEMLNRAKPDYESLPLKIHKYYYYIRYEEGDIYYKVCRKKSLNASEEIIFDVNKLAKGHSYYSIGGLQISPDDSIIAYAIDTLGNNEYTYYFKNMFTNKALSDTLENLGGITWANDNKTIFYTSEDSSKRSYRVWRYVLNSNKKPKLIYEEKDNRFSVGLSRSKSDQYIYLYANSKSTSEQWFLPADSPLANLQIIEPRKKGHEYSATHYKDKFYIMTNDDAENFKLMETTIDNPSFQNWKEVIPHDKKRYLVNFEIFDNYIVTNELEKAIYKLKIYNKSDMSAHYIDFDEDLYTASIDDNPDFDTNTLRFGYSSFTTPLTIYDYNMVTKEKTAIKQDTIQGYFNPKLYRSERIWATAEDGTKIPIILIAKKGVKKRGDNKLLLTAYGAYGDIQSPSFSTARLSLLDRGFVYAIAQVRGGADMGKEWYNQGKKLNKKNTFNDFIACAEHLIDEKYTNSEKMVAMGGSAGGLLMGVVANERPNLFKAIILNVPFVDVVNTMMDESLPLTTGEYEEWGNPNDKEVYNYIKSYSPYDNIKKQDYPAMLFTTAFNDSQVGYWEPAKMVAKLRTHNTSDNPILLKTDMNSGHSGASGRFSSYSELAYIYAFILDLLEID